MTHETKKDKEFSSERHTLFIKDVSESKKLIDKEKKLYEILPKYKTYIVYINAFRELKRGLHAVFNELRDAGRNDVLEFRISSHGGFIKEGQQFYNIIQEIFNDRVVAYLDNHGYSMGALLFCMATKRVVYPHSDIMFHNYYGVAVGKGQELETQIKHSSKVIRNFFYDIIVKNGFLTQEEFEEMIIGKDFWMDTKQMCKKGIATHVVYKGEEKSAKEYLKILKKEKKKSKNKNQKPKDEKREKREEKTKKAEE